jgi:hypothetical protein
MRQQTTHDIQSKRARHDQTIEADSLDHQYRLRSAAIDGAIDGAQRLAAAIGADQSELSGLIPTAAGEISMTEAHDRLSADREHRRQVEAEDQLRRETWKHDGERQERAWDRSDKRLRWESEREDAERRFKVKLAELQAQADVVSAGIARGLLDHQTFDRVMGALSGMVKQLQSASDDDEPAAKLAGGADRDERRANDGTLKRDVVPNAFDGTTNYDRLVEDRLRSAAAIGAAAIRVSERRATGADEVALHAVESQIRAQLEQIDEASRVERGRRDAEVDRKIAELTEEFRRMDF